VNHTLPSLFVTLVSHVITHTFNYRQHCAKRRYLIYSEANFEVFRPDWGEI